MGLVGAFLGTLAAVLGALIHLPDDEGGVRPLQIALNELPWIPAALGVLAVFWGLFVRPRNLFAVFTGLLGAALSLKPLMSYRAAVEDMELAMRVGLGKHYESHIAPAMFSRLAPSRWTLGNSLGARERSAQAEVIHDVVYAQPDGLPLKLDIYQPTVTPAAGDLYPAVVVIHGGGWRNGDKGEWFAPHSRTLAAQGYVVFDIQYRLSGQSRWPAQFDDIQAAIRWVRRSAPFYQVDPDRIAVLGRSAGGHLALMAGMCAGDDTSVQAVVSFYGPAELHWPDLRPPSAIYQLMGGPLEKMPAAYAQAPARLNMLATGCHRFC